VALSDARQRLSVADAATTATRTGVMAVTVAVRCHHPPGLHHGLDARVEHREIVRQPFLGSIKGLIY
jgi:hypothetical protein